MKKKNETEKVCRCGRIITDPENKTGLCPTCEKKAVNLLGAAAMAATGIAIKIVSQMKENGPKVVEGVINIIKNL